MLDAKKLTLLGPGSYRYAVTSLNVFQLQLNPVVSIAVEVSDGKLKMSATDSELQGLGLVDDFVLSLDATLEATENGLEGQALLAVSVTQPPLLKLIPKEVLEKTGESILSGILLAIKSRVGKQLVDDFKKEHKDICITDIGNIHKDGVSKIFVTILASLAEIEREKEIVKQEELIILI